MGEKKYPLTSEQWTIKRADSARKAVERRRKYYEQNREQILARSSQWHHEHPRPRKVKVFIPPEVVAARKREANRKKYLKHRDKILARKRAYQIANREKRRVYKQNCDAKKISTGRLSAGIVPSLMVKQRGMCPYCKSSLKSVKTHLDHIVPLKLGGPNTDDNVQLLCQPCNQAKHAKHPVEFANELGMLL